MASRSPSSPALFFGTASTSNNMERMTNFQQELLTSLVLAQQDQPNTDIVIELSPTSLLDPKMYICDVCYKRFSRNQNLIIHRRVHNLPSTLKTRTPKDPVPRKVYVCPERTCLHHNRSHALVCFSGLRKHYLRKHCAEKMYKCDTCSKAYGVKSDLVAHSKICTRNCSYGISRGYPFNVHQENCDAPEHFGEAKDQQTLHMGEGSVRITRHNNNNIPIGSTMSLPATLGMGDNATRINSNENHNTFIGSPIYSIQNQYNSYPSNISAYQSQLRQFGADHSSPMNNASNGLNMIGSPPAFFSNEQGYQENLDMGFYADILKDRNQLHNVNLEDVSLMGDCGNIYGSGEGSKSLDAGFMLDSSSLDGMLNPLTGSSYGGIYEQGGYSGYHDGSGHLDYRGGMEDFNFDTATAAAATTGGSLAPSEWHSNQQDFDFDVDGMID